MSVKSQSYLGIQYARGIAALLVVLYHAAAQMAQDPAFGRIPHPALEYGYVGVPIFFLISGFIITVVSLDSQFSPKITINNFVKRRAVRILPFMWFAIIAYNLLSSLRIRGVEWEPFLRALFLWPAGSLKPNVIWTLRHEAIFYGFFAFSFLGARKRPWLLTAWCLSPVFAYLLLPPHSRDTAGDPSFRTVLFSDVNFMFGAGLLVGLCTLRYPNLLSRNCRGGAPVVYAGGSAIVVISWLMGWRFGFVPYLGITVMSTLFLLMAIRLAGEESVIDRAAGHLGNASYALYLVHNLAIVPGLIFARRFVDVLGIWPIYVGIVVFATAAGVLAHLFLEKPLTTAVVRHLGRVDKRL